MPKIKTHKSLQKRVEVTSNNKLRARKMSVAHRARFKSKRALKLSTTKQNLSAKLLKKIKAII
ncbi:50S ribosomal protein L35 [Candidatus Berkelbacteria bacterium]|nr:50S ribosomal protein L35 [Candidatus Berkelbacteria bacterium]